MYVASEFMCALLAWLVMVSVASSPAPRSSDGGAGGKISEITRPRPSTKVRAVTSWVWHHPGHWNWHYSAKYEYIRASFSVSLAT